MWKEERHEEKSCPEGERVIRQWIPGGPVTITPRDSGMGGKGIPEGPLTSVSANHGPQAVKSFPSGGGLRQWWGGGGGGVCVWSGVERVTWV